jgi:hypothetical protein
MRQPDLIITRQRDREAEGTCSACNAFFSVTENPSPKVQLVQYFNDHVRDRHREAEKSVA